jgi:aspartate/methionine/tyrosine aminotransferase
MPRHPEVAGSLSGIGGSVFSSLTDRIRNYSGEIYPLHVGDTWLDPAEGCRMQDLTVEDHPGLHRYAPPRGRADLIDAVAARARQRTGVRTEPQNVLIAAGATGALGAVMGSILNPGDEVLVVTPFWPLITGIIRCFHGKPVLLAIDEQADSPETLIEAANRLVGPRTAALYVSTPNNPSGRVISRPWLEALAEWARSRDLWIVSDEVYEDYVYSGEHIYCRSLAPERTFSTHSFSKAFGMAGNRCGYVVGPDGVVGELCKVSTHSFYSTPTASQIAAVRVLDGRGDRWIEDARELYRALGEGAAKRLGVAPAEGGQFLFLDVADRLDERGLQGFLEKCADSGLFLAPGPSFGPYPSHVRICFTCAEPSIVERGVDTLARLIGR